MRIIKNLLIPIIMGFGLLFVLATFITGVYCAVYHYTSENILFTEKPIIINELHETLPSAIPLIYPLHSPDPTKTPYSCWKNDEEGYVHSYLDLIATDDGYVCDLCGDLTPKRYGFTEDDIYLLAQLLCGDTATDGDGEYDIDYQEEVNYYEVSKVLCVVMNRQRSEDWPDTVKDVVLAPKQFSVFPRNLDAVPSEKAITLIRDWTDTYDGYGDIQCIPEDHVYFTGNGLINITRSE